MRPALNVAEAYVTPPKKVKKPDEQSFIFKFKPIVEGNFKGQSLWELSRLDSKGKVIEVVMDADHLTNNFETMMAWFENKGL